MRVLATIADVKHLPPGLVAIDRSFEELGIDSLDAVEILWALDNEFDITIPDESARSISSVQQMVDGVVHLVTAQSAGLAAGV
jgi:acyl carrier protein